MEYYSAMKGNELSSHRKTWRKLKCTLLSKKPSKKATQCMISTIWHSGNCKPIETIKQSVVDKDLGREKDEWTEHSQFLGETSLYDTIMVDTCPYMFVQPHRMYNEQ